MTLIDWTRSVSLGGNVIAEFRLSSGAGADGVPIAISLDLEGDGLPGAEVFSAPGGSLQSVGALGIRALRRGRFRVVATVLARNGCSDRTGALREVEVK
jgi:hypothetical protein